MTNNILSSNVMRKRPRNEAFKQGDEDSVSTTISTTSPSQKRLHSLKTKVRFTPKPHDIHVVPRWTEEETSNSWYSQKDIFIFRYQEAMDGALLRNIIKSTPTIDTLPQEAAIYRGLERLLSDQIAQEICDRRNRCVIGVLLAQRKGLSEEVMAMVSRNYSEKGVAWALTLGSI